MTLEDIRGAQAPGAGPEGGTGEGSPEAEGQSALGETGEETRELLPERYVLRKDEGGHYLTCLEAPNIAVRIAPKASVPAAAARRASAGTIFLDGSAQDAPFMDAQRRVYNLDHHEGCVRAFTLATCEQAMVLVRKGLDLKGGEWSVVAGEPDLDTVLAIWVLLNHMRLGGADSTARRAVMPLIRLEGVIDAHGFELKDLCGFPPELLKATLAAIDRLRDEELMLKREGRWVEGDLLAFSVRSLMAVDELVYSPRDFDDMRDVDEVLRLPIGDERVALVCRSEAGIYEVEEHLERLHGDRIGLIILEKSTGLFTLRQADPFLPVSLESVYDRLNLLDPAVSGHDRANRWGGSAEIGGSPRRTGSGLTAAEVARICQGVYRPAPLHRRIAVTAQAVMTALALFAGAAVAAVMSSGAPAWLSPAFDGEVQLLTFDAVLLVLAAGVLLLLGRRSPRQYGLALPTRLSWLAWLPVAGAAAWFGGAWLPAPPPAMMTGAVLLIGPLACELLFRGVVQGMMLPAFRVQHAGSRRFVSVPALVSWVLSTAATVLLLPMPLRFLPGGLVSLLGPAAWLLAAAALGAVAANARERAESVVAPLILHVGGAALVLILAFLV